MNHTSVILGLGLAFTTFHAAASAGSTAWTSEQISPAVNYAGQERAVRYAPDPVWPGGRPPTGAVVKTVQAVRDFPATAAVQTRLCWKDMRRCVAITGRSLRSEAFNGLDARGPFYLVHSVPGKGPLAQPVFVKGSVTVWYQ